MKLTRIISLAIVLVMALSVIPIFTSHIPSVSAISAEYPLTDYVSLWVRKNGSDPGFPFGGANVPPTTGMNYFRTQTVQIVRLGTDYSFADMANEALFPAGTKIYVNIGSDPAGDATLIADAALTNSKIMGCWWDDFPTGQQSHANMTTIYTNVHHNDGALGRVLTLGLVVYQRTYMVQSPYTWASIMDHFDILHFWYYPDSFSMVWANFAGLEDSIRDMHSIAPTKEIWIGIYLHFYNGGDDNNSYPYTLTYNWMALSCRLIREGLVTHLSILETFWIQHNVRSAEIVKDFLDDQFNRRFLSTVDATTNAVVTTADDSSVPLAVPKLSASTFSANNLTINSYALQNITVSGLTGTSIRAWDQRTGEIYDCVLVSPGVYRFYAEPNAEYRVVNMPWTNLLKTTDTIISSVTEWKNKQVYINASIALTSTLYINNSIVHFGPGTPYLDSMKNSTVPTHNITMNDTANAKLYILNSSIEPTLRDFPFAFVTNYSTGSGNRILQIVNSTLACYAGKLRPMGYTTIYDSTLYSAQPNGETNYGLWTVMSGVNQVWIKRSLIWNGMDQGAVGAYFQVLNGFSAGGLIFNDNDIAGAGTGLWIDTVWVHGHFYRNLVYPITDADEITYVRYKSDGYYLNLTMSSPFRIDSGQSVSGAMVDGSGTAMGTFSTNTAYEITTVLFNVTAIEVHPYPWTFVVGVDITYGVHLSVAEIGSYHNRSNEVGPRALATDVQTFYVYGGMDDSLTLTYSTAMGYENIGGIIALIGIGFVLTVAIAPMLWAQKMTKEKKMPTIGEIVKMLLIIIVGCSGIGVIYAMI